MLLLPLLVLYYHSYITIAATPILLLLPLSLLLMLLLLRLSLPQLPPLPPPCFSKTLMDVYSIHTFWPGGNDPDMNYSISSPKVLSPVPDMPLFVQKIPVPTVQVLVEWSSKAGGWKKVLLGPWWGPYAQHYPLPHPKCCPWGLFSF